jgi:hypothetical protein
VKSLGLLLVLLVVALMLAPAELRALILSPFWSGIDPEPVRCPISISNEHGSALVSLEIFEEGSWVEVPEVRGLSGGRRVVVLRVQRMSKLRAVWADGLVLETQRFMGSEVAIP